MSLETQAKASRTRWKEIHAHEEGSLQQFSLALDLVTSGLEKARSSIEASLREEFSTVSASPLSAKQRHEAQTAVCNTIDRFVESSANVQQMIRPFL